MNKATVSRTLLRAKKVLNDKAEDLRQEDLREHPNRLDLAAPETARYVLSRLTETQAVYLYLYYGEWLDMRSIGALLGVDHSTVCRTIHRAAGRIRALCTDGSGVELLGVDALEPALYALYRQHAADDLIPERAKAAARKAAISGCKKRQERTPDCALITAPIWGQRRHRAAAQSRLLRALEEAAAPMYYRFAPRASARAPAGFLRLPQGRLTTKARRIMKRSPAKATPMTNKF